MVFLEVTVKQKWETLVFKVGLLCIMIILVYFEKEGFKMLPCKEMMMFEETDIYVGLDLHIMQYILWHKASHLPTHLTVLYVH